MLSEELHVVTGAFSYTGRYVARRLLARGVRVLTLTDHPCGSDPFAGKVAVAPLDFGRPSELIRNMGGAAVLYNTYWVRFPWAGGINHERAVENTLELFKAAAQAGVRRIVHVSIANAGIDSPLPCYRGKAEVERALCRSGTSYAIARPTLLFGGEKHAEDVLVNNIAWILRRLPLFGIPGKGTYRLQPIHVDDFARALVEAGEWTDNVAFDAAGPEVFSFEELVRLIAHAIGSRSRIVHFHPRLSLLAAQIMGELVEDIVVTADELEGLSAGLLASREPPVGTIHFSDWIAANRGLLGVKYASEIKRHYL